MGRKKKIEPVLEMNTFPEPMVIHMTNDYSKFSFLPFNRTINRSNVKRLKEQTVKKFELHKFPILCDENLNVIDGQHRFTVAIELGAPVYYIIDSIRKVEWTDVHGVNIAGKKHGVNDKLNMMLKTGHKQLVYVKEFHDEYAPEELSFQTTVRLLHVFQMSGSTPLALDLGTFEIQYEEDTKLLYAFLETINYKEKELNLYSLAFAIANIIKKSPLTIKAVLTKFGKISYMLEKRGSREGYIELLRKMHNHKLGAGNKISD